MLTSVALQDAQLSEDEQELLKTITTDIQGYFVFIDNLKLNRSFSKTEVKEAVKDYKKKIYTNAFEMSKKVNGVSEEELNILLKLQEILNSWTLFDEKIILKKYYAKYTVFTNY